MYYLRGTVTCKHCLDCELSWHYQLAHASVLHSVWHRMFRLAAGGAIKADDRQAVSKPGDDKAFQRC